jgi:protoheme IX farnesyltransferase
MPHFMSLAWLCRKDYAAGGYKMLSLVDPTGKRTAACALRNCMYLLPLGALSTWLGITSPYFAYESAFISAGMLLTAANFYAKPSNTNARILFRASLLHLPIFMISFLLHRIPNTGEDRMTLLMEHARLLGMFHGDDGVERHAIQHPSLPPALVPGVSDIRRRVDFIQPPLPFLPVPTSAYASTQAPQGQEEASDS